MPFSFLGVVYGYYHRLSPGGNGFESRHLGQYRSLALGNSEVECLSEEQKVAGSKPASRTILKVDTPHSRHKGNVSEAYVVARLLELGFVVLVPIGNMERYDLVLHEKGKFIRVQVKTGRLRNGVCKIFYTERILQRPVSYL